MKKRIILIAAIMLAGALAFGETGWNNHQWWTDVKKYRTDKDEKIPESLITLQDKVQATKRLILGKKINVYFLFPDGKLTGISYTIESSKTEELKKKFNQPVSYIKFYQFSKEEIIEGAAQDEVIIKTDEEIEWIMTSVLFAIAATIEQEGMGSYNEGDAQLSIYDYNDDTRVYIYENIMEGQTVVVYVPHEQDF